MNEEIFREPLKAIAFNEEALAYLKEIIQNFSADFASDRGGYYSDEVFRNLIEEAGQRLAKLLSARPQPVSFAELRTCWNEVLVDYHRHENWNFPVQETKPAKELTEEQKTARELGPYIWVLIQSSILLKTVVYYFGINTSAEPSTSNKVMLALALLTSLGTLVFFAWRKSRK